MGKLHDKMVEGNLTEEHLIVWFDSLSQTEKDEVVEDINQCMKNIVMLWLNIKESYATYWNEVMLPALEYFIEVFMNEEQVIVCGLCKEECTEYRQVGLMDICLDCCQEFGYINDEQA